jgi:predicted nucleic acid-binding Zn ribbon protein
MPIYNFRDNETGEEFEKVMGMSEREEYLKDNPQVEQLINYGANVVHERGTNLKVDDGFRETMSKIKDTYKINKIKDY